MITLFLADDSSAAAGVAGGLVGLVGIFTLLSIVYGLVVLLVPIFLWQQSTRLYNILEELRALRREHHPNLQRNGQPAPSAQPRQIVKSQPIAQKDDPKYWERVNGLRLSPPHQKE